MTKTRAQRLVRVAPALLLLLIPLRLAGQQGPPSNWADNVLKQDGYQTPPKELADAVLAPRYLNVSLTNASPDKKWFLDEIGDGPVPMKTFSKPFHELGGVFVDFKANRARTLTTRNNVGIQIISAADGSKRPIQVPPGARVSNATWSPDGTSIAYFVHSDDATHIWVADVTTGKSHQLTKTPVLATLVTSFDFTADGKQIAVVLVPDARSAMPPAPVAPTGPTVKIADSDKNRLRTFPSLMSTTYEKELLEWHSTGQVALIDVQKGTVKKIGQPTMVRAADPSPDGKYVRVTRMVKPFSYDVPVSNFGSVEEVWDADGKMLAKVTDRPINLGVQDDNAPPPDPGAPPAGGGGRGNQNQQGKREIAWRSDNQGLTFVEQEPAPPGEGNGPGGRAGRGRGAAADDTLAEGQERGGRAPQRKDRVYQWLPPFDDAGKKVIYENASRMNGVRYSPDMQVLFFSERAGQNTVETAVYLADTAKKYTLARYRTDDVYANPGSIASTRGGGGGGRGAGGGGRGGFAGPTGPVLVSADKEHVFFQGSIYDKNPNDVGPKTFIDKVAIKTGEKQRIYESENSNAFERVSTIVDADAGKFIVARESPSEVPQQYLVASGTRTQLTHNQDYLPDLTRAPKERFFVERADGFKFKVSVTLPPGYQKGTRLPAIFWFYPREFQGQEEYDRPDRTFNKNTFPNFGARSMEFFVRLGYAVVEPDAPIVGPQNQMNNNYVNDLRNDLAAVIDELDRRALVDRTRLAIGGHSYGAFSTVNAMVHTPFFKAGIAGDGAYNRTLTPIGFQSERRDLWEARDVYLSMSPFLYANNLTGALLMYHGLADQNVGTDPTNSLRLYHALNGLGKTAALYLYPLEDHGPASKETLLDLWSRWAAWLDKYVKNPEKKIDKKITTTDQASRQH
ncbi:MAG TPA: prolyl oligopeptidase family serine peptidase [Vicinamibacterales bacterium]|jgi:dipeptidyl aminopeptidase/acylaminoacyl peptidase|nr:prolyl oligopeptidase family serine peptidase [Vicinamibacterales bacterium]